VTGLLSHRHARQVWRSLALAMFMTLAPAASIVRAQSGIVLDQWYEFQFGLSGTFAFQCINCVPGQRSMFAASPPWTINSITPFTFFLADGGDYGDSFTLFDNAAVVGSTPPVGRGGGLGCNTNEVACFNDPLNSKNSFAQAGGSHSYTIRVDNSPQSVGAAYFCLSPGFGCGVTALPEPGSLFLVASGCLALIAAGWRSRRSMGRWSSS